MFKFLIILFLISYVVYKVGGFIFKSLFVGGQEAHRPFDDHSKNYKPTDGNVYVKTKSEKQASPNEAKEYKGGDYIDFEEVE